MLDVLIAGAGPAGSIAGLVLARAGVRVVIVDRDEFPRDKLCGDTINPGAVRLLRHLGLMGGPIVRALPLDGMTVTGGGAAIVGQYGAGEAGLALRRREFDAWLLDEAVRAGARFESSLTIRGPLLDEQVVGPCVRGLTLRQRRGGEVLRLPALMTIGADGRRSVLARTAGLAGRRPSVCRWAFGTYASGVAGMGRRGEMHIQRGAYIGLAPVGHDEVNVCVVRRPRPSARTPLEVIRAAIATDPVLTERFAAATFTPRVAVLGPLAADVGMPGTAGLLLAGDAAGFVDPMTGDGLHLALQGGLLAAEETLRTLESGDFAGAPARLAQARRARFGRKLHFDRMLRRLVETPGAVAVASLGARLSPWLVQRAIRYAGDVG